MDLSNALFLDTETTCAKAKDDRQVEVIELSWKHIVSFDEPITRGETRRFKPRLPPQWGAIAVHGILMSELEGKLPSEDAHNFVPKNPKYWIGHNIDFDWKALGSPDVKRICTLAMARDIFPELDSHTLTACTYYTQGATPETREKLRAAHSAAADVDLCLELLETMCKLRGFGTVEELWEFSEQARVPKIFTFGKFAGQPIAAADRGYAQWYRKQPDPDPYMLTAFKIAGLL